LKLKKQNITCPNPEGMPLCEWTIIDVGDVIVHLFKPETRLKYNLDRLWKISFDSLNKNLVVNN
tara:strand:+ start:4439 stop:4630 length:192 start_codon:yes stop_codon:yes gene_type:complete